MHKYPTKSTSGYRYKYVTEYALVHKRNILEVSSRGGCAPDTAYPFIRSFIHSFIHSGYFYSTSSSPLLLRGAPDYSTDTVSESTRQSTTGNCKWRTCRSTWWLARDSNLRPFGRKATNLPMSHHTPQKIRIEVSGRFGERPSYRQDDSCTADTSPHQSFCSSCPCIAHSSFQTCFPCSPCSDHHVRFDDIIPRHSNSGSTDRCNCTLKQKPQKTTVRKHCNTYLS